MVRRPPMSPVLPSTTLFLSRVVVRPAGGRAVTVSGPLAREIGAASGADVWVRGRRAADGPLEATSYAVRSVDGVTAVTGNPTPDGDPPLLGHGTGLRPSARPPPRPPQRPH